MRARRSPPTTSHTMRLAALVPALSLFVLAIVSPIVALPSSVPELAVRDAAPLEARAPAPSLAARAPAPSARSIAKRALRQKPLTPEETLSRHLCPTPMRACPIDAQSAPSTLLEWIKEGFECVDPQEDLTSCGGCGAVDAK